MMRRAQREPKKPEEAKVEVLKPSFSDHRRPTVRTFKALFLCRTCRGMNVHDGKPCTACDGKGLELR